MKTAFYTWLSDDFRDTIIDFEGFIKSFKRFHPDIDMHVFNDEVIKKVFAEKPWLNKYNCKPSFAKLLYDDYDLVVNVDSDFYFFDRCEEILSGDYEVAACANYNAALNTQLKECSIKGYKIAHVNEVNYLQAGLIASTSKAFWDEFEEVNKNVAMDLPLYENDVLNIIWYSNKYKTKLLDGDVDYRSPNFKCYYNCAGLGRESAYHVINDKIYLDDKPVKAYHVAYGNAGPNGYRKRRLNELFSREVCDWFDKKVLSHE